MELMELYNQDTIGQDFHPRKLVALLLNDNTFPIYKERIVYGKGDYITLESNKVESPYMYIVESGIGAIYIGKQIIDFVGEGDFIGLHHSRAVPNMQINGVALTGKMTVWRLLLSDVIAKIMSIQEGYLYHYNYMRMTYERYALKIVTSSDMNQKRVENMLQVIVKRFGSEQSEDYVKIPRCFTRDVMANYAGVSKTTLSGILTQLEEEEYITFQLRNIFVLNEFCM
ncbi:Crp/Fnr family transcriptional regulator [Listeria booriae]|uniref:Crp/Fnr family transcriptional regulator n=1 Tax=Listeria booriae TaxID=1552123 RepID=A0A7X1A4J1_9LIST|nr:Crp/Fnr family transcriptional regulator [Listeria booriae]MBC1231599.1 Crp/Fnr family transcriptional regulator [Listeria booriae]MBC1285431.1 Crp/Fnr family transcriptional regulator [Listeria booriae]MBC1308661.1 Crp/Fnr family transcriptional regulator [Listeria booriae]MBC2366013.1 Crp/Fnr family transcriptional regulator [Listeria booriae]MBC2371100.1 Crp/Fnr family transcriptional regulator [Listeria booriae]